MGSGGVRPHSLAFGAYQIDNKTNVNNGRALESFFWGIVYIQDHAGWKVGFGFPAMLMC
ncbi:putative proton-dependent oligopeptide transporter family [Helianthus anomalus]